MDTQVSSDVRGTDAQWDSILNDVQYQLDGSSSTDSVLQRRCISEEKQLYHICSNISSQHKGKHRQFQEISMTRHWSIPETSLGTQEILTASMRGLGSEQFWPSHGKPSSTSRRCTLPYGSLRSMGRIARTLFPSSKRTIKQVCMCQTSISAKKCCEKENTPRMMMTL